MTEGIHLPEMEVISCRCHRCGSDLTNFGAGDLFTCLECLDDDYSPPPGRARGQRRSHPLTARPLQL